MKLKSYFADSVQEALDKARLELGHDAMLISSRETGRDLKDLGCYEVVFGVSQPDGGSASRSDKPVSRSTAKAATSELVLRELGELRRQMECFSHSVTRSSVTRATEHFTPELTQIFNRLQACGFSSELACELSDAVARRTRRSSDRPHRMSREHEQMFARDLMNALVEEEVASRFEVSPVLGENASAVMFVGSPGSGKTTSLVKLALQYGVRAKRNVTLLSLDTMRITGCEQLRVYARISGLDFHALSHPSKLRRTISGLSEKGLTLIDTPGFSKADEQEADELAGIVKDLPIEVHLVLPAHLSPAAVQRIWERFAKFKPSKLLFTHLDEVEQSAAPLECAMRLGLPVSYLGTGQQVPEDICQAEKAALMTRLAAHERAVSMAA